MHQQGAYMMNASQELTFHKYGIGFTLSIFLASIIILFVFLVLWSYLQTAWSGQHGVGSMEIRESHDDDVTLVSTVTHTKKQKKTCNN
jgi:hypothetical protein